MIIKYLISVIDSIKLNILAKALQVGGFLNPSLKAGVSQCNSLKDFSPSYII